MREAEHESITYLKQDQISKVLMKGLADTYKHKPGNPVDYFAKWLLNYNHFNVVAEEVKAQREVVNAKRREYEDD
jgi:hypothetical protein